MAINPKKGDVVSFQFERNGLIGDGKQGVRVDGELTYNVARSLDPELNVKHRMLYPYFQNKVNNIDDPTAYGYIVVANADGRPEVIGIPWIKDATFQFVQSMRNVVNITNWQESWEAPLKTFMTSLGANYTSNKFTNE